MVLCVEDVVTPDVVVVVDLAERKYTPAKAMTRIITTMTTTAVLATAKLLFFPNLLLRIMRYETALFTCQYLSCNYD